MDIPLVVLGLAVAAGFYACFMGGANDVANSFGTSVGSKALTLRQAVLIASVFELAGAVLVGTHVTDTVRKGIVDPTIFRSDPWALIYGMLAAITAAGVFLHVATHFGLPVSTTHATVGAVLGFGLIARGFGAVQWSVVGQIAASWVVSPVCGGVMAYFLFRYIHWAILNAKDPVRATYRNTPPMVCLVVMTMVLSLAYKGLEKLNLDLPITRALALAAGLGLFSGLVVYALMARAKGNDNSGLDPLDLAERPFKALQVLTACLLAFAHGANNLANGVGPVAAIFAIRNTGKVTMEMPVDLWILVYGAVGIVIGLAIYGTNVIRTIGEKLTAMTPSRGFAAQFAAAATVLICSKLGMPISTTHTVVGGVIGVAMARGIGALDLKVVRDIFATWVVTVPATIVLAILFYWILAAMFL